MLTLLSIILVSEFLSKEHPLGLWRGIIGFGPAKVFIIFLRVLKDVWYSKPGFHLLDCMLRSAVGKTHDLRSDLWWTIPLRILLGPLSRVHFGESLVIRLYSEIDHIHLSSEAQCVSHLYPQVDCHTVAVWNIAGPYYINFCGNWSNNHHCFAPYYCAHP